MIAANQREAMAEMYAQGYVTLSELAAAWGVEYWTVKSMRARGSLPEAILGPDNRMWFVPATTPRPERRDPCPGPAPRKRPAPAAEHMACPPSPPAEVHLDPAWARWGVFGEPQGRRCLGWLGGWTRSGPWTVRDLPEDVLTFLALDPAILADEP